VKKTSATRQSGWQAWIFARRRASRTVFPRLAAEYCGHPVPLLRRQRPLRVCGGDALQGLLHGAGVEVLAQQDRVAGELVEAAALPLRSPDVRQRDAEVAGQDAPRLPPLVVAVFEGEHLVLGLHQRPLDLVVPVAHQPLVAAQLDDVLDPAALALDHEQAEVGVQQEHVRLPARGAPDEDRVAVVADAGVVGEGGLQGTPDVVLGGVVVEWLGGAKIHGAPAVDGWA
jgi:hypothetical protein